MIISMSTTEKQNKLLRVHVTAGAKKETFSEEGGLVTVAVKEKAEKNMANVRVRELIAEHYHIPLGAVKIITGHHFPKKIVSVTI